MQTVFFYSFFWQDTICLKTIEIYAKSIRCKSWSWGTQTFKFCHGFFVGIACMQYMQLPKVPLGSEGFDGAGIVLYSEK